MRAALLHFDATLALTRTPGGFGWDNTASVLPVSMVPASTGPSSYLLMIKYNNCLGAGTGDGVNRIALVDPGASQADAISGGDGVVPMAGFGGGCTAAGLSSAPRNSSPLIRR